MARNTLGWSFAALLLSVSPAFAPPPPPPPKPRPATPQELMRIPAMVGLWQKHNIDRYCSEDRYPASLNITAADTNHIVMNGQAMKVTAIKAYNVPIGLDVEVAPNGFRLHSDIELEYFPLDPVPGSCHYTRNSTP